MANVSEEHVMPPIEPGLDTIAEWVKALLPPELWERHCHLTYAQMALVPELAEYATQLHEADKRWQRAFRARRLKLVLPPD